MEFKNERGYHSSEKHVDFRKCAGFLREFCISLLSWFEVGRVYLEKGGVTYFPAPVRIMAHLNENLMTDGGGGLLVTVCQTTPSQS